MFNQLSEPVLKIFWHYRAVSCPFYIFMTKHGANKLNLRCFVHNHSELVRRLNVAQLCPIFAMTCCWFWGDFFFIF